MATRTSRRPRWASAPASVARCWQAMATTRAALASAARKTSAADWQPASGSKPRSSETTTAATWRSAPARPFFNRRSTVSLSGGFGEVAPRPRLHAHLLERPRVRSLQRQRRGHQRHRHCQRLQQHRAASVSGFAPTPTTSAPAIRSATSCRRTWVASTARSCTPSTSRSSTTRAPSPRRSRRTTRAPANTVGGRFGYANGPLDVAASYGESTIGDNYFAGLTRRSIAVNLGASYDFGLVKLFGEFSKAKLKTRRRRHRPASAPSTLRLRGPRATCSARRFRSAQG